MTPVAFAAAVAVNAVVGAVAGGLVYGAYSRRVKALIVVAAMAVTVTILALALRY